MSNKRLFDHDPLTGITQWYEETDDGEGFRIYSEQDAKAIIEANKQKQAMGRDYYARDKDMWKVACIPLILHLKWAEEQGIPGHAMFGHEMTEITARKVNDPDYRHLKTADVRI